MFALDCNKKKADAYIGTIYAATLFKQIKWVDTLKSFYTEVDFNSYSFEINSDSFKLFFRGDEVLSFKYGECGDRLFMHLTNEREKAYLGVFKEALEAIEKQNEKGETACPEN